MSLATATVPPKRSMTSPGVLIRLEFIAGNLFHKPLHFASGLLTNSTARGICKLMRDVIRLATEIVSAALLLSVAGAAAVAIWFIVGGQS